MADEAGITSAGATTSKRPLSRDFEVFLNFRGPDSRNTVADVIYDALARAGVQVFYDDESIRQGEVIEEELTEAITNSKIYIPIFSRDYASSKYCLRELAKIMDCWEDSKKQEDKKMVLPIFYNVDVSKDIKLRSEVYTTALQKHKNMFGEDMVKPREVALLMAATIRGWDIRDHRLTKLSKLVVEIVCRKLGKRSDFEKVSNSNVAMEEPIGDTNKLLKLDIDDGRFATIHSMDGIEKKTLARLLPNEISSGFEQGDAFLSNIGEKSHKDASIMALISQLLHVKSLVFVGIDEGIKMIKKILQKARKLIILVLLYVTVLLLYSSSTVFSFFL